MKIKSLQYIKSTNYTILSTNCPPHVINPHSKITSNTRYASPARHNPYPMTRLKLYIDLAFCLVFLPMMIIIFPVERWLHNFTLYTIGVCVWLYAVYLLNRICIGPMLCRSRKQRIIGIVMIPLTVLITYLIAHVQLYVPKPNIYDHGIVRHLPTFEQYQQCIWSLFVIVEFFSIAFTIIIEHANQRDNWLLRMIEESQTRELLEKENRHLRHELNVAASSKADGESGTLLLKSGYKNIPVDWREIVLIEAMENYVKVYRGEKSPIVAQTSMKLMEEQLCSHGRFIRTHRSYIVATSRIAKYTSREVMVEGHADPIPVGRKYAASLKAMHS